MSTTPETLGLLIKRLQDRHHRQLDSLLAPLGLSLVQWNALREIERNPGASQHQLALLSFNSDQAFGTLTARLLQRGLIERQSGPGRAVKHQVTPAGMSLYSQGVEIHAKYIASSFARLDAAERNLLHALLSRLLEP